MWCGGRKTTHAPPLPRAQQSSLPVQPVSTHAVTDRPIALVGQFSGHFFTILDRSSSGDKVFGHFVAVMVSIVLVGLKGQFSDRQKLLAAVDQLSLWGQYSAHFVTMMD